MVVMPCSMNTLAKIAAGVIIVVVIAAGLLYYEYGYNTGGYLKVWTGSEWQKVCNEEIMDFY